MYGIFWRAHLGYHPHIFSTMAESIAKTNENVARKSTNRQELYGHFDGETVQLY